MRLDCFLRLYLFNLTLSLGELALALFSAKSLVFFNKSLIDFKDHPEALVPAVVLIGDMDLAMLTKEAYIAIGFKMIQSISLFYKDSASWAINFNFGTFGLQMNLQSFNSHSIIGITALGVCATFY